MKKVFIQTSFIAILLLVVTSTFLNGCKKKDDNNVTPVVNILPVNTSNFTFTGTQYSGVCDSFKDVGQGGPLGNIDVDLHSDNNSNEIAVLNMPKQSSGTYTFTNGFTTFGGSELCAVLFTSNIGGYYSTSGTIKKTGANSFIFSCQFANSSNTIITATGQGTY